MDLIMVFIDTNKKFSSTLPMALPMTLPKALRMDLSTSLSMTLSTAQPMTSILVPDANDKVSSTLVSSLVTAETNIALYLPLLPYPNNLLLFHFNCITGIDFTYHPLLYHSHSAWIETILPIL